MSDLKVVVKASPAHSAIMKTGHSTLHIHQQEQSADQKVIVKTQQTPRIKARVETEVKTKVRQLAASHADIVYVYNIDAGEF